MAYQRVCFSTIKFLVSEDNIVGSFTVLENGLRVKTEKYFIQLDSHFLLYSR